jgi:hypothetical protein
LAWADEQARKERLNRIRERTLSARPPEPCREGSAFQRRHGKGWMSPPLQHREGWIASVHLVSFQKHLTKPGWSSHARTAL